MIPTDMLYFAVARDGTGRRRRDHRLAQSQAVQRHEDGAARSVSAERRRRDLRHPRHDRRRPAAAAGARAGHASRERNVLDAYVEHVLSFIDPAVIRPFNVVLDAGSGMGGPDRAAALRRAPLQDDAALLRDRRPLPEPRSEPAHRGEPPRHHRAGDRASTPTSASPGTAMPTAASSSTAPASSCRAISSRRCSPKRSC